MTIGHFLSTGNWWWHNAPVGDDVDDSFLKDARLAIDADLMLLDYRLADFMGALRQRLPLITIADDAVDCLR